MGLLDNDTLVLDVPESRSSFISKLEYDEDKLLLRVFFRKHSMRPVTFADVYLNHFKQFAKEKSIGKFYLHYIKPNFKQVKNEIMDEQRKIPSKNQASDKKRFINISIDVRKINKEWITSGEKGDYLNVTLQMLPDGELDRYGNLGMVVQAVPGEIYKAAEKQEKGSGKKLQGAILGNGIEIDWAAMGGGHAEANPANSNNLPLPTEPIDDLPF